MSGSIVQRLRDAAAAERNGSTPWQAQLLDDAADRIERTSNGDAVPVPVSADHARAMVAIGQLWLENN